MRICILILALVLAGCDDDKPGSVSASRDWRATPDAPVNAVPEPSAGLLFGMGLLTLAAARRRPRR